MVRALPVNSLMLPRLLKYIQGPDYRPMKPQSLAKKMGVKKKEMGRFEQALTQAKASGEIRFSGGGRVQPGKAATGGLIGIVRRNSSGDGFIILHEPKLNVEKPDIFVDRRDLKDAQTGDEVLVRLNNRRRSGGQRCGEVVEVLERRTNVFVGTYFEDNDAGWVKIDGKDFSAPVWVGDPGAKGAAEGDKVVVEMLRFPTHINDGEGVLTKVLGDRATPGVDTQMVIHQFGLPDEFPEEVLSEARLEAENFDEKSLEDREDLTGETIVTIDPADARDFDDAISLTRSSDGHWHLGVHIADVSHFVQPGTALDREAEKRGTSVYLPTKVIPMLPEVISNGLASLQEKRVRYVVSAFIEYTADGIPVHRRFARCAIKVKKRFAYEEVLPVIRGENDAHKAVAAPIRKLLTQMHELAMLLRRRRFEKGALELDMPEIRLEFDKDLKVIGAKERSHDESHQIIEEFMLAANIAVATELDDREQLFLRRVHADPAEAKLIAFGEFAGILGYPIKRVQSRMDLQNLLRQVKGKPEEHALNYAMLRSLKQAEYSPVDEGHYALSEENYCHFTSPIRRYPDLLIHRLITGLVTGNETYLGRSMSDLLREGKHCSLTERRAEQAERELIKLKLLAYMTDRVGEQMEGYITGVERWGFFVRGTQIPAEGLVHITSLPPDDIYDYDQPAMALIARRSGDVFRLGDRVMVEVAQVDLDRRELNLRYIGRAGGASTQSAGGKKQQSRKPKGDSQQFRSGKKQSSKGDSKGKAKGRKTGSQSRSRRDRGSR